MEDFPGKRETRVYIRAAQIELTFHNDMVINHNFVLFKKETFQCNEVLSRNKQSLRRTANRAAMQ